jgi:hypothetical protein
LDLSNEVLFPGACSSRTKIIAVGNGDPSFVQSSCDATFVHGLLTESTCSSLRLNAHDVAAGGCEKKTIPDRSPTCEWYDNFPSYSDLTFTYDANGALLATTSHAQGDMLDRVVTVDLTSDTVRTCDREANECSVMAASEGELQGAQVSAEPEWLHPPGPQPDFAGTACITDGSIAAGHISQRCGTNALDYSYDERGHLTEYDWLSLNPDSYTAESESRSYFDRAGNDRYSLYSSVSVAGVRGTTVAHEGSYECFPCSYSVPDGGLRVDAPSHD